MAKPDVNASIHEKLEWLLEKVDHLLGKHEDETVEQESVQPDENPQPEKVDGSLPQ